MLPDKWYLKVDKDNVEILSKWRTAGHCSSYGYVLSEHSNLRGYWTGLDPKLHYGFKYEISFEEFRKYVLNECIEEIEEKTDYSYLIAVLKKYNIK